MEPVTVIGDGNKKHADISSADTDKGITELEDAVKYESELLRKLVENTGKQLFYARITSGAACALTLVITICLFILVPKAVHTVAQVNLIVEDAQGTIELADEAITSITDMSNSITEMGGNMDNFITENAEAVTGVMQKIEAVDFEGLNGAIKDLGDVIEPLANFFNRFK